VDKGALVSDAKYKGATLLEEAIRKKDSPLLDILIANVSIDQDLLNTVNQLRKEHQQKEASTSPPSTGIPIGRKPTPQQMASINAADIPVGINPEAIHVAPPPSKNLFFQRPKPKSSGKPTFQSEQSDQPGSKPAPGKEKEQRSSKRRHG